MNRRTLLASLAMVSAGCLSDPGGAPGTDESTTNDDSEATTDDRTTTTDDDPTTSDDDPGDEYEPDWALAEDPAVSIDVGSRDAVEFPGDNQPWSFAIWNDTGGVATVQLEVSTDADTAVDRQIDVDERDWIDLSLLEPADYRVEVAVGGDERWAERYSPSSFTCNSKRTTVALGPGDAVETRTLQTMLACNPASVGETSFQAAEGDCNDGTGHEATVSFGDEAVHVDGTVMTPTPCFDLSLHEAAVTEADGTLTVVVEAARQDGVCVECIGAVDYGATLEMTADYPDTVVVEHLVDGERTVVTRDDR